MSVPAPLAPILSAVDVTVCIGNIVIVEHASFGLRRGEFAALVGPNGAGKTTLLRALAGLVPADGRIEIEGAPFASLNARARARAIAYLPQGHVFHWPLSVQAIVALGRHPHADPFTPHTQADTDAVRRAMAAAAIEHLASRSIATLSGGERARVALARALATQAPILLADEPTASLDARHQLAVMDLLRQSARAGGAILAVIHDLMLAARFADRVLVMDRSRLVADGVPAEALSPQRIAEIFRVDAVLVEVGDRRVPVPRAAM